MSGSFERVNGVHQVSTSGTVRLWNDNPATLDLLGFHSVAEAVITALSADDLDPVTIAIQSPWGGGKSTALELIGQRLDDTPGVIVVRADPWEYDEEGDVRGTLIGQILSEIAQGRPAEGHVTKIRGLLKRIAWVKVGTVVANTALTMQPDPQAWVEALTPGPEDEQPRTMAGFKAAFEELMEELEDVEKVVVLVDDLDRCLPPAVMATLEAIKLFLSVPKMAFVLAADQEMVRNAIAASVDAAGRGGFAERYLEKIVQLPVTLPRLSPDDAETYIALLLSARSAPSRGEYSALVDHVQARRIRNESPYLVGPYAMGCHQPTSEDLQLASQLARGLAGDKWSSPRAIKRFLNAWGVREAIAKSRGVEISPGAVLKLYILEDRYPADFEVLVGLSTQERLDLLPRWEAWGRQEEDAPQPDGVSTESREWAGSEPSLDGLARGFDAYLSLAATFTAFSAGGSLPDEVLRLLDELLSDSDVVREEAIEKAVQRDLSEQRALVQTLLVRVPRLSSPEWAVEAAVQVANKVPSVVADVVAGVRNHAWSHLQPVDVAALGDSPHPEVKGLLREIQRDQHLSPMVRTAAEQMLSDR
ncbi:KAP family P-loop NTPase fold protein [Modestobacter sp. VKM Ac-2985]|uniref:KAP family P-loop NTPase fold protein n=1 Tax=Modestobacter sp. VKM Ac-2985 TaxID=3004139 RepID=UPI0022AB6250|nr:P-loop NTPase fold protein [Modestobacter sp. VKM Ac-2985]MCZ2836777.1 P-loop NTPase fold protein [Modestobacter sp. VKM Ac-2985]